MLPIIVGAIGVGLLVAAKGRPSTLFRVAEDTVVSGAKGVARGTKRFTRNVKVEMQARQLAAARRRVKREEAMVKAMSPAQRKQYDADMTDIVRRASELGRAK